MAEAIRIEGLAQFSRALRKLDADAPKGLRVALNTGARLIVTGAASKFPRKSGRAVGSLKAKSTRTEVRVSEGGPRVAYVPWLDFGGTIRLPNRRRVIERPFEPEGRFLYRTYYDEQDHLAEVLARALIDVVRSAGLAVD